MAVALLLSPLVVLPTLADAFRLPKLALSEALMLLSALILVAGGGVLGRWRVARTALLATAPLVAVSLLSAVLGSHPAHGAVASWNLLTAWLVLLVWTTQRPDPERILALMLFPAGVVAGLIVGQYLGLFQSVEVSSTRGRTLLSGFVGNVGEAAHYLVPPLVCAAVKGARSLLRGGGWLRTTAWALLGLLLATAVVMTETVTAVVMVVLAGLALLVTLPLTTRMRAIAFATIAVVCLLVPLSPFGDRFSRKAGEVVAGDWERVTTGRTDGWRVAMALSLEHPVLGVGLGGYAAAYTPTKERLLADGVEFFRGHAGQSTFGNAHSEVLEVAAESGWAGVLALLFCAALTTRKVVRDAVLPVWRRREEEATDGASELYEGRLRAALVLGVGIALVVQVLTYFPFRTAVLAYPFLLLGASLLADPDGGRGGIEVRPALRRTATVAVAALLLLSLWLSQRRIVASARLLAAESTAASMMESGRLYPGVLRAIRGPLEEAVAWAPWDERLPIAVGSYQLLLRRPERAEEWYLRSMEVAPRPETIFNIGRALMAQGRDDEAVDWFARSVRLDAQRMQAVPAELKGKVRRALDVRPGAASDPP